MSIKINSNTDLEVLFNDATTAFFNEVRLVQDEKIVVALPGGRSIRPFLVSLVARAEELALDFWNRLEFFMVDERFVPVTDEESNFNLIRNTLHQVVEELILRERQLHPFTFEEGNEAAACDAYSEELAALGGRFHICCLGAGEDGHVAGLFPGHASLQESEARYLMLEDSPKPPPRRLTSSAALIGRSDAIFGFFIGEGKQEAFERFKDEQVSFEDCPAKILHKVSKGYLFTNL